MTRTSNRTWAHALATVAALAMACSTRAQDQAAGEAGEPKASGPEETRSTDEKGILPIPEYGGDLWTRPALTGDWGGTRTDLANQGIQLGIDWVQTVQSIVDGGSQTTTRYGGSLDYLLYLDLYRMGVLPGALVKIRAETRYGESVNKFAGPLLPVDTDGFFPLSADNIPFTITDLAYYQFLSEKFGVFLGKFDTLDGDPNPFASGRGNTQFLNSAFVFNPVTAMSMPYSTLGVGVIVKPVQSISINSLIMNTTDASTTTGFGDFGDGWTWATEADFQYQLCKLPGGQNLGFLYAADRDFFDFSGRFVFIPGQGLVPPTQDDTWALFWSGWQYLFTEDDVESPIDLANGVPLVQGFGVFARAGTADQDTNPIDWNVSAGFGGRGVIPSRDNDLFGIGYYYAGLQTERLTSALGFHDNTQAFEAFYSIAFTPAAQLTFDLQVGRGPWPNLDPAVILGMRLFLNF